MRHAGRNASLMEQRPSLVEIVADPARQLAALLADYPDVQGVEIRDHSADRPHAQSSAVFRASRRPGMRARHRSAPHAIARHRGRRRVRLFATRTAMNLLARLDHLDLTHLSPVTMVGQHGHGSVAPFGVFVVRAAGFPRAIKQFTVNEFRGFSEFMILVFASFVVPILALAFGTASVGGDREDRTLVFLLIRPIPRAWCCWPSSPPRSHWSWGSWSAAIGSVPPGGRSGANRFSTLFAGTGRYDLGLCMPVPPVCRNVSPRDDHRPDLCAVHGIAVGQYAGRSSSASLSITTGVR